MISVFHYFLVFIADSFVGNYASPSKRRIETDVMKMYAQYITVDVDSPR